MCCNNNNTTPINNNWRERAAQMTVPIRQQAQSPQIANPVNYQQQQQMIIQRQQAQNQANQLRLRKTYR